MPLPVASPAAEIAAGIGFGIGSFLHGCSPTHSISPSCGCTCAISDPCFFSLCTTLGRIYKQCVNSVRRIALKMAYDPGALNAALAAAVGDDGF